MTLFVWAPSRLRTLLTLLLVMGALAGCRSYGSHGAEEATMEQIREANRLFAESLQRAQSDLNVLQRAAAEDASLEPHVEKYQNILTVHEAILAENREVADRVAGEVGFNWSTLEVGSYRTLNRALGAISAEEKLVRQQYASFRNALVREGEAVPVVRRGEYEEGRYAITPLFYARARNAAAPPSMREVLALREQAPSGGDQARPVPSAADTAASVAADVPGATEGGVVQPEATPRGVQEEAADTAAADTASSESTPAPQN